MKSVPFAPLEPALYREAVRRALAEDLGWGDVTTEATVDPSLRARGVILAKCECVIAGLDIAAETFSQLDPAVVFTKNVEDGQRCVPGTTVALVRGSAAAMLTAERTALNFLQRLSGIASVTRRYVDAAGGAITVLDTRKTTPTLRALEKYAVRAGGGTNHRGSLDDGILIKDNHIRLGGGVAEVMRKMRRRTWRCRSRSKHRRSNRWTRPLPRAPISFSSTTFPSRRSGSRSVALRVVPRSNSPGV